MTRTVVEAFHLMQISGLERGHLVDKQKAPDDEVAKWAGAKGTSAAGLKAKTDLDRLAAERAQTVVRDYLYSVIPIGPLALKHAAQLVRLANERAKPDAERDEKKFLPARR